MKRRDFVAATAAVSLGPGLARAIPPAGPPAVPGARFRAASAPQEPSTLTPAVFAERRARAQEEMGRRGLDALLATPGTNFLYLTGGNPGRSERLIALLLPRTGEAVLVAPHFEVERVRRGSTVGDVRGWEEEEDPFALVGRVATGWQRAGHLGLESSTDYASYLRLAAAVPAWQVTDGGPVFERLRIIKQPVELDLIRRAIRITQDAMCLLKNSAWLA